MTCCSFHDRPRPAFSLVETIVCLVILALALVPIISLFTTSRRISYSARTLLDVSVHAQTLLEAISQLSIDELPSVPADGGAVLIDGDGKQALAGSGRWQQVVDLFSRPPPMPMERRVVAERLKEGELMLRVDVEWIAVVSDQRTRQKVFFVTFANPAAWK